MYTEEGAQDGEPLKFLGINDCFRLFGEKSIVLLKTDQTTHHFPLANWPVETKTNCNSFHLELTVSQRVKFTASEKSNDFSV